MRELVVLSYCDNHPEGELVPDAVTRSVALDGGRALEFELCPACNKAELGALEALLERVGRPVESGKKRGRKPAAVAAAAAGPVDLSRRYVPADEVDEWSCPVSECGAGPWKKRSTLTTHLKRMHGLMSDGVTPLSESPLKCVECGAPAADLRGLKAHGRAKGHEVVAGSDEPLVGV